MNRQISHPVIFLIIGTALSCSVMAPAQTVSAKTWPPYTAKVENDEYEARIGEPFFILLSLDPANLPAGYYVSTLVEVIDKPDGSKVETFTGFPSTRLTMTQAGIYRFEIRVSLLAKSSCGGIDAKEILAEEIELQVVDP